MPDPIFDYLPWSHRFLSDPACNPCEQPDCDIYHAQQTAFVPVFRASSPDGDERAFLQAHRRAISEAPSLNALTPADYGTLAEAQETALAQYDLERASYFEARAAEHKDARDLMAREFAAQRKVRSQGGIS